MEEMVAGIYLDDSGVLTWRTQYPSGEENVPPGVNALWGLYVLMITQPQMLGESIARLTEADFDKVAAANIPSN